MLRSLRVVHRWIGLALAVPMVLVALSGSLLVFRDAYYRARWPVVAQEVIPAEMQRQPRILESIEARFGPGGVRSVKFPRAGVNAFHVYLSGGGEALVHPATGDVIARWHWRSDPAAFLFELHAKLLMGARGEVVNGFAALLLVFLSLSGLLLWLPRRSGAFRLRHALPRRTNGAAMLRSHAASGVWLLGGVLLFAATGAGLVFYEQAGAVLSALSGGRPEARPSATVEPSGRPRAAWTDVLAAAREALPESGPAMYYPGPAANPVITFRKRLPGEWHPNGRSYVLVDPYTADVVQTIDARTQGANVRVMHALYPVHAAKVGGLPLMALAVLTGIGLAWLGAGGAWSYLARVAKRPIHRAARNESRGTAAAARAAGSFQPHGGGLRLDPRDARRGSR